MPEHHLKRKFESLQEEGKAKLKVVGSDLVSDLEHLGKATKEIASDSLDAVKDELGGLYKKGQKKMAQMESQLESHVKANPMRAILVAAGIGFAIGWQKRK